MSMNLYVGMDVHKETISIAFFEGSGRAPIETVRIANEARALRRLLGRWQQRGYDIRARYEAGGAGYVIHRMLTLWGYHCDVIAPIADPNASG